MDVFFQSDKLQKDCESDAKRIRRFGPRRAKLIQKRLDELIAATTLADMQTVPQARCHELHQNRAGTLSVDLDHPYRLLFSPYPPPPPKKPDGGLDWTKVTAVLILEIEDTHG